MFDIRENQTTWKKQYMSILENKCEEVVKVFSYILAIRDGLIISQKRKWNTGFFIFLRRDNFIDTT